MWFFNPDGFLSISKAYDGHVPKPDLYLVRSKFRGHIEQAFPHYLGAVQYDESEDLPFFLEVFFYDLEELFHKHMDGLGKIDLPDHPDIRTGDYKAFLNHIFAEIMGKDWEEAPRVWTFTPANLTKH